jgi:urease accessory protein
MAADAPHPAFEAYAGERVPQAAPGSPGKEGRLELAFARCDGETHLVRDFARAPFHLSGTLDHDPRPDAATVFVQSPTGGVAQGDRRHVSVSVGPDAVAHVSTQSSTKVFSMETNYAAADLSLSVAAGGHLDYVPEPTILHPDARFCQSLELAVAPDASAVLADIVVPGRLARGEAFQFERYYARTEIESEGDLLAADATHLRPDAATPAVPGVLGENRVYGTLFAVAPGEDAATLSDAVHEAVADRPAEAGASALPNGAGAMLRALGETTEPVRETLRAGWSAARERLADAPAPERRK